MVKYTVAEAARMLEISPTSVYRYLKKRQELNRCLSERNEQGQILIDEDAFKIVTELSGVKQGNAGCETSDKQCLADVKQALNSQEKDAAGTVEVLKRMVEELRDELKRRDGFINKRDEQISQMLSNQAEERHRADTIIMNMSNQVKSQMMLLEDLRKDIDQVKQQKVEKAEEQAKPVANEAPVSISVQRKTEKKTSQAKKTFGTLYRMFLETFQPWKLRDEAEEEKAA